MSLQKQPSRRLLKKRCSKNMQQIYSRPPMPKCDLTSKSHFDMGVLLWICCIFSEHLFHRTPMGGCFFVRHNLHLCLSFRSVFACTTKYNEAFVIHKRKKESWYPHVTIINHVTIYEKTPWKYWICFYSTSYLVNALLIVSYNFI